MEKQSNNSLYGHDRYDTETIDRYDAYQDDDIPMSMEEKALVRKIDFFLMPLVCLIDFLQVQIDSLGHHVKYGIKYSLLFL